MKDRWDRWELIAIEYLERIWYKILDTNFKFGRFWEIDIICKIDDIVVFIEVKYRSNMIFWTPEESITKNKLFKVQKTIEYYSVKNHLNFEKIRFDIITIVKLKNKHRLTHYKNQSLN